MTDYSQKYNRFPRIRGRQVIEKNRTCVYRDNMSEPTVR